MFDARAREIVQRHRRAQWMFVLVVVIPVLVVVVSVVGWLVSDDMANRAEVNEKFGKIVRDIARARPYDIVIMKDGSLSRVSQRFGGETNFEIDCGNRAVLITPATNPGFLDTVDRVVREESSEYPALHEKFVRRCRVMRK